jgi:hypothetical protein
MDEDLPLEHAVDRGADLVLDRRELRLEIDERYLDHGAELSRAEHAV